MCSLKLVCIDKSTARDASDNIRCIHVLFFSLLHCLVFFFFQAEDGIRVGHVTGVQTCALPISRAWPPRTSTAAACARSPILPGSFRTAATGAAAAWPRSSSSAERRGRLRWPPALDRKSVV